MRNRALVAASVMMLAGCAGTAHGGQSTATAAPDSATSSVSAAATPFGVSSPSGIAAAGIPPSAAAAPSAAAVPGAAATPAPAAPAATTAPLSAAVPAETVPAAPARGATAAPRILSVQTSPAIVHDGDTLLWNVRTTTDVVDVVAHVTVYAFRLAKQGTGAYVLTFTIPHGVPGFFHGTYTLDLVARSATGAEVSTKVPVTFQ